MMRPKARRKALLDLIRSGTGGVDALARQLNVSPATVRRDLGMLAEEGLIARTYGGAAIVGGGLERSLQQRATIARPEKQRIAAAAMAELQPGSLIYLDAGTTVGALAELIASGRTLAGLTVATHSLSVVNALCEVEDIELIVLGGTLRKISQGMIGPLTEQALAYFRFATAFIGADAVSPVLGVGETTLVQIRLKQLLMARAEKVVVLADGSKLAQRIAPYWAALPAGALLITDGGARAKEAAFAEAGISVRFAE
jgi:DeoR family fructose operon transcriptional repressor